MAPIPRSRGCPETAPRRRSLTVSDLAYCSRVADPKLVRADRRVNGGFIVHFGIKWTACSHLVYGRALATAVLRPRPPNYRKRLHRRRWAVPLMWVCQPLRAAAIRLRISREEGVSLGVSQQAICKVIVLLQTLTIGSGSLLRYHPTFLTLPSASAFFRKIKQTQTLAGDSRPHTAACFRMHPVWCGGILRVFLPMV